ncbi:MAG: hypothetical protein AB1491_07755 [Thermodesulfobacteriota bacterium]
MRLLILLCFWAILGPGGCRSLPPAPPPPVQSAAEVLSQLRARQQDLKTFAAKGRLTWLSPERNYSGTGLIKGRFPTTLRVDILDFFGRALLSFSSDGREVQVFSPKEAKFFSGAATPANLAAFIPPGVTLPQTLSLLTGDLPLSKEAPATWRYDPEKDAYLLEWRNPDGSQRERLWVAAPGSYPLREEWYDAQGRPLFTVELSDFDRQGSGRPQHIKLHTRHPEMELRLAYREMQLNPALPPGDFTVSRPPGVVEVPLTP